MRQVTSDDDTKLMLRFSDSNLGANVTGTASLSVVESGKYENRFEVYGSTGALMVEESGELWHSPAGSGSLAAGSSGSGSDSARHARRKLVPRLQRILVRDRRGFAQGCEDCRRALQRLPMVTRFSWCWMRRVHQTRVAVGPKFEGPIEFMARAVSLQQPCLVYRSDALPHLVILSLQSHARSVRTSQTAAQWPTVLVYQGSRSKNTVGFNNAGRCQPLREITDLISFDFEYCLA